MESSAVVALVVTLLNGVVTAYIFFRKETSKISRTEAHERQGIHERELGMIADQFRAFIDERREVHAKDISRLEKEIGRLNRQMAEVQEKEAECRIRMVRMEAVLKHHGIAFDEESNNE